jgi:predicted nucleotidyltransferase
MHDNEVLKKEIERMKIMHVNEIQTLENELQNILTDRVDFVIKQATRVMSECQKKLFYGTKKA